jgi:hypothetical protein
VCDLPPKERNTERKREKHRERQNVITTESRKERENGKKMKI